MSKRDIRDREYGRWAGDMPLGDMLNLDGKYYLKTFHLTREALCALSWGSSVPERETSHLHPVRTFAEISTCGYL